MSPLHFNSDASSTVFDSRPRVWPAVVIALVHVAAMALFARFGTTNIHNSIALGVVPSVALIVLSIWWFAWSGVSLRDRLLGCAFLIVAVGIVVFSQATVAMGGMLLARALPIITNGFVLMLVVTGPFRWQIRRWLLVVFLLLCSAVVAMMRVDSIGGDLYPILTWKWDPTVSQRSEKLGLLEIQQIARLPDMVSKEDWPAFRGANRDGRVEGIRFRLEEVLPLREIWRRKIGSAWSSVIVIGDYLFTQEQRGQNELVCCYHADTGEPVWQNAHVAKFEDAMGTGPRATPAYADGRVFAIGGTGIFTCLDAQTGSTLWQRDLVQDGGGRIPEFGFSSSPLVLGEVVYAFTWGSEGKSLIAYHVDTGQPVWMAGTKTASYASPHLSVIHGEPQLLMVSNFGIQAFSPTSGHVLWEHPWGIKTNPRCTQPFTTDEEYVVFGATGTSGTKSLQIVKNDSSWHLNERWSTRQFRPYFNDGVLHQGYLYGFDGDRLACLDLKTGKRVWSGERYNGQVVLLTDLDLLLVIAESGDVVFVQATPAAFHEVGRFKALTGKTWNHPAISRGKLYLRNAEEAACFLLSRIP